jgi:pyruvyltransferase
MSATPGKRVSVAMVGMVLGSALLFNSFRFLHSPNDMQQPQTEDTSFRAGLPASVCSVTIHAKWMTRPVNFGDLLVPMIISRLTGCNVEHINSTEGHRYALHLLSIGSSNSWPRRGIIWGAGVMDAFKKLEFEHPNAIRAVRGPRTRSAVLAHNQSCPEAYGDIALVLPYLFPELKPTPTREYIVTPHMRDEPLYRQRKISNIVSVARQPMEVIHDILQAKKVISSSLHGIITAEAFGIPAVLIFTGEDYRGILKYYDYYEGTGRYTFPIAKTVEEALAMEPPPPPQFDAVKILATFPFELYGLKNPYV